MSRLRRTRTDDPCLGALCRAPSQAFDGFGFALIYILSSTFVFEPRLTQAKRYALCPWVDFLNHDGALTGSEVSYEYFTDGFAVRLDEGAGPVAPGQQVMIAYGPRSNDVLLQYYGFVQPNNPHDAYALEPEGLILGLDAATVSSQFAALEASLGSRAAAKAEALRKPAALELEVRGSKRGSVVV